MITQIVILGSGNVATHIAVALKNAGCDIVQVYSRTPGNASALANTLKCEAISDITVINTNADLYIFAVSDSVIPSILSQLPFKDKLVVHTAGSVSIKIFEGNYSRYGVFYPLQTFSKGKNVLFSEIPILVEANNPDDEKQLLELAHVLSNKVKVVDSKQREILHLAAVFANNFTNHMVSIASQMLAENNIPFYYLKPLLEETISKAMEIGPLDAQTGPAKRNNKEIMQKHLEMLADKPEWQKIYTFVSESIIEEVKGKEVKG